MKRLHNIDTVALDNPGQFRSPPQRVRRVDTLHGNVAHRHPRGAHAIDQGIGAEIEYHHTAFESIARQKSDELCQMFLRAPGTVKVIDSEERSEERRVGKE